MGQAIHIRRGFDIKLVGKANTETTHISPSNIIAIQPPDFKAVVPKLMVKVGDEVLAGQPLFFDRERDVTVVPSPVSGEVVEIVRGDKRLVLEIRIIPDKTIRYKTFDIPPTLSREEAKAVLMESGCWSYIRQRPYQIIANAEDTPKAVWVSCFDSAPLAPDYNHILEGEEGTFRKGLEILNILADGKLHVGIAPGQEGLVDGVVYPENVHSVTGPHPAGNVGIQIHHINPIQRGQVVWYVNPQDVVIIGRLFNSGRYIAERTIALTGSHTQNPQYVRVMTGQPLKDIVAGQMHFDSQTRVIQGNPLTGREAYTDNFLSFYENQLTALPEGDKPELFGWLLPGLNKLSLSHSFFSWLQPNRVYNLDTNTHGEERAFVMSGEYEKVLPMNIMPVQLLKAIMANDLEKMENLGIYEVAEEDFALCEFVCTSKIDVQQIIGEGLELIRIEG